MSRRNNGRWMLGLFVVAAIVVPGAVAASRSTEAPAPRPAAADLDVDTAAFPVLEPDAVSSCKSVCSTTAQCRLWCDEPSAYCAPSSSPPHYKFCVLP